MRFSYLDILEQCFHDKFIGYNKQEVDNFLEFVADDFREIEKELRLLKQESEGKDQIILKLETQLRKLKAEKIQGSLISEEYSLKAIRDKAENILELAREKANQNKGEAERELNRLREEIRRLQGSKTKILESLKVGAKNHLESLYRKRHASGNKKD